MAIQTYIIKSLNLWLFEVCNLFCTVLLCLQVALCTICFILLCLSTHYEILFILQHLLDQYILCDQDMANLDECINKLREMALAENASTRVISTYLGAVFSFGNGNANRPDICTNATLSEGLAWNLLYTSQQSGENLPQFKVRYVELRCT